jgi:hypothetical protein
MAWLAGHTNRPPVAYLLQSICLIDSFPISHHFSAKAIVEITTLDSGADKEEEEASRPGTKWGKYTARSPPSFPPAT